MNRYFSSILVGLLVCAISYGREFGNSGRGSTTSSRSSFGRGQTNSTRRGATSSRNSPSQTNSKFKEPSTPAEKQWADALKKRDKDTIREMLKNKVKVDVNLIVSPGDTALSVYAQSYDIVDLLIKAGASPYIPANQKSPILRASEQTIMLMLNSKVTADKRLLSDALAKWVSYTDYGQSDWKFRTEFVSRQDIMRKLIAKGASPNASGSLLGCYSLEDMKILTKAREKLNWNITNRHSRGLLHIWVGDDRENTDLQERERVIKFIVSQGAAINMKDSNGFIPILYCRDLSILKILLESPGAKSLKASDYIATSTSAQKYTNPLEYWINSLTATQLLLAHKASPNAKNSTGKIPLAYLKAKNPDFQKIIALHKQYGVKLNAELQKSLEQKAEEYRIEVKKEKVAIETAVNKIQDSVEDAEKFAEIGKLYYRLRIAKYADYPEQAKYLAELQESYSDKLKDIFKEIDEKFICKNCHGKCQVPERRYVGERIFQDIGVVKGRYIDTGRIIPCTKCKGKGVQIPCGICAWGEKRSCYDGCTKRK